MSQLLEILRKTARTTALTGAFLATAAFTHLYTKIDVENNMRQNDNEIIVHHNDLVDAVNSWAECSSENRESIENIHEGLTEVIEWFTKEGIKYRIAIYGLAKGLQGVGQQVGKNKNALDSIAEKGKALFDGKYDFNNSLVDHSKKGLEGIAESLYFIETETVFERKKGAEVETAKPTIRGGATAILNGQYLITCNHVVNREKLSIGFGPWQMEMPGYEKKSEVTYLLLGEEKVALETVLKDKANDVAIFKVPEGYNLHSLPCALGNSDELQKGNFLYVVGVPGAFGVNVREGIYSTGQVPEALNGRFNTENAFMVSCGLNPGDSGTMIIGVRDGQYEFVGLPQGKFMGPEKMGWAIGMTPIKKLVRSYLEQNDLVKKHKDLYDGLK